MTTSIAFARGVRVEDDSLLDTSEPDTESLDSQNVIVIIDISFGRGIVSVQVTPDEPALNDVALYDEILFDSTPEFVAQEEL